MYVKSTPHGQFDLGHGDAAGQRGRRALKVLQGNLGELPVA